MLDNWNRETGNLQEGLNFHEQPFRGSDGVRRPVLLIGSMFLCGKFQLTLLIGHSPLSKGKVALIQDCQLCLVNGDTVTIPSVHG